MTKCDELQSAMGLQSATDYKVIQYMPGSLFNKVAGLRPAILSKKRLWHMCFPLRFGKILRTPVLQSTTGRLLLDKQG